MTPTESCNHASGRILTYEMPGYRWLEQCQRCGALFTVDHDNVIRPVPVSNHNPEP